MRLALLALFVPIVAAIMLLSAPARAPSAQGQVAYDLYVHQLADFSDPAVPLAQATLDTEFWIRLLPETPDIASVDFTIDGANAHRESQSPYIYGGNSPNGKPWNEALVYPGVHTVTAVVNGPGITVSVTVGVAPPTQPCEPNPAPPTTLIFTGPAPCTAATLPGVLYGRWGPATNAVRLVEAYAIGLDGIVTDFCGDALISDRGEWVIQIDPLISGVNPCAVECQPMQLFVKEYALGELLRADPVVAGDGTPIVYWFEAGGANEVQQDIDGTWWHKCGLVHERWSIDQGIGLLR